MNNELVTVIIPTYNREDTIQRAVMSVLEQTYKNLELIVVDDCSTDNTISIVSKIDDERLKIVKLEQNGGACKARNIGIKNATGKYIAFQDSDDEWLPNKLEEQIKFIENTEYDMVFCALNLKDYNLNKRVPVKNFKLPATEKEITISLLEENYISTQTILAKREVFNNILFDEKFPRFQDWDLVVEISKKYKIGYIDLDLVNVYRQNDSISKNNEKGLIAMKMLCDKNKKYFEENKKLNYYYQKNVFMLKTYLKQTTKKEAKELLKEKFDLKILIVYLLLSINKIDWLLKYKKIK